MADFSVACVLYILRRLTLDMSAYPKLVAWLHDSLERPAAREHSRVQFIREKPPSALHRADQVQNVVLVPRRDRPPAGGRRLPSGGDVWGVFAASRTGTKSQMSGGLGRDRWSRLELKDLLTNAKEDVRARLEVRYVASPEASLPLKRQSACLSNLHRLVSVTTAPARLSITSAAAAS